MSVTFLTDATEITGLTKDGTWRTATLSVPSDTTVVFLRCRNIDVNARYFDFRAPGSTDIFLNQGFASAFYYYHVVKVISQQIEYRIQNTDIEVHLIGYANSGTWLTNVNNLSLSATGSYETIDL